MIFLFWNLFSIYFSFFLAKFYLIFFLFPAISLSLVYSTEIYIILSQKCLSCGIYFLLGSLLSVYYTYFHCSWLALFYLHKLYFFFLPKKKNKKKLLLGFLIIYLGNNKSENANLAAISADSLRSKYVIQISLSIFLKTLSFLKDCHSSLCITNPGQLPVFLVFIAGSLNYLLFFTFPLPCHFPTLFKKIQSISIFTQNETSKFISTGVIYFVGKYHKLCFMRKVKGNQGILIF